MSLIDPPFTVQVLDVVVKDGDAQGLQDAERDFTTLLPATTRGRDRRISVPQLDDLAILQRELLVKRLDDIAHWLWVCGRPMPPRPLHHQVLLSRKIVVTEKAELHLVWYRNRMMIKPIPPYLLDPDFWTTYLLSSKSEQQQELVKCARGFLHTYTALIAYPSDFLIAQEKGLLPSSVTWERWRALAAQLVRSHRDREVNPRYWYGELRLSRLNKVYQLRCGFLLRTYSDVAGPSTYMEWLSDNFAALAASLGYVLIVLTAMQVGLATNRLQSEEAFQNASWGFTVFAIIAPLVGGFVISLVVAVLVVDNWRATKKFERERFQQMELEPPSRSSTFRRTSTMKDPWP